MTTNFPEAWLVQKRRVRFGDTDGAGVMHFHQLLRWSHEAWEESLECYGIPMWKIFPSAFTSFEHPNISLPIINCQAKYKGPIHVGDELIVKIHPHRLNSSGFQIETEFILNEELMATSIISHVAINPKTRRKCELPESIDLWLEASSINQGPKPT